MRTAHVIAPAHGAVYAYTGHGVPSLTFTATEQATLPTIAAAYAALPELDPAALPAWRALEEETWRQLGAMESAGLTLEVCDVDPYATPADLFADVTDGRIRVLGTHVTGGHPVWSDDTNNVFRAVHDVMGHAATGRGFDRHGEATAYAHHRRLYSPTARLALATELRGQAATLAVTGVFPEQRIGILPMHLHTRGLATLDSSDVADAIVRHYAGGLEITD